MELRSCIACYEDGFADGFENGREAGILEACANTNVVYEERMKKLWAEMQTLNARISYLDKQLTEFDDEE